MCGIIGYIGSKPVVPVLIDGLRRMEYRGYDSAGVALVSPEGIALRRSAGKLINLENTIRNEPVDGLYGVGHTRWATHGRPTEENAHPHRDCTGKIVVVHNGIIENYLELKHELQQQGHEFKTETDTEIVAHLVEREMKDDGLENAVRRALLYMRGMFAIVLVSVDDPEKIVAARNGPPIVVGLGRGRVLRRLGHPGNPQPHARRRVPRRRGDGDHHALGRDVHRLRRQGGLEDLAARDVGPDRGGEGRPQALHAQGDLRAAGRCPRHHSRSRLARPRPDLPRGSEHRRRHVARPRQDHDRRLRHVVARRAGRQVSDRGARPGAGRSRLRLRVPLPQPDRHEERADDRHHPVGRDRRHARRVARGTEEGRQQHRHLQRRRQHGHARGKRHGLHARRPGDRCRVDEGVHLAAGGAATARPLHGAGARQADAGRDPRPHRRDAADAAAHRAGNQGVGADGKGGGEVLQPH